MPAVVRPDVVRLVAADFTDPEHERLILLAVGGLALLGVVMIVVTVMWWRGTRGEHPALAPLEVMGERSWTKATFSERRRRLDSARPPTSDRFLGSAFISDEVDLRAASSSAAANFDDLREVRPVEAVPVAPVAPADAVSVAEATVVSDRAVAVEPAVVTEPAGVAERAGAVEPADAEPVGVAPSGAYGASTTDDTASPARPATASRPVDVDAAVGEADADESPEVIDPLLRGSSAP